MNTNPASAQNNKHHTDTSYKSQAELDEELFGRGKGDPDVYPIPDEATDVD